MPDLTYSNVQPIGAKSATSDQTFGPTMDFQRRLHVVSAPTWWEYPVGREIYSDTFEDVITGGTTTKWLQNTAAVAADVTTAHYGARCLKITAAAGAAGTQAIARKHFLLPADQGFYSTQPGNALATRLARIIIGCWFRQADANLRTFTIRLVVDDTNRQREFWTQYHRRQAGVDQNFLEYLLQGGAGSAPTVYPIDGPVVGADLWQPLIGEYGYVNGTDAQGGYGIYYSQRIGDVIAKYAAPNLAGALNCFQAGTSGNGKYCFVDLIVTTDNANACSVYVDDFMFSDLSWAANQ